ncbi:MAG: hybrid sensor histidine kinase/response regulator [Leptospiraceae bacterium]|nr:hybrid sensor histidine kinase/response regulator [Leptospiraceae bacterium]MCP5496880.1 hybrid sensor histidine kinase/response regulator [Leptospiraceae bacterium]
MKLKNTQGRIIIVDDVPKNIQLAANILTREGFHVEFSTDGNEVFNLIKDRDFDLILLDIMMPKMDGYDVCKQLKQNENTKDIPIIFLTAKSGAENITLGLELGAVDYVTKPFNIEELVRRVRTHVELKKKTQELKEANLSKDKFFSIIAHDLKNPFNAIMSIHSLLREEAVKIQSEQINKYLDLLVPATKNAYSLLENLLEWSRLQNQTKIPQKNNFSTEELIYTSIYPLSELLKQKEIELIYDLGENTKVLIDIHMMGSVLRNLLSNAIKFTKRNGKITIKSEKQNGFIKISVSDSGVGIPEKRIKSLFVIGEHVSSVGTEKELGTGLGLILCKEFVEKHSGKIWVESIEGQGSVFCFTIPA